MSKVRQRKLRAMMQAAGLTPSPPPPPRVCKSVTIPFFTNVRDVDAIVAERKARMAAAGVILAPDFTIERKVQPDEIEKYSAWARAYQNWLVLDDRTRDHAEVFADITRHIIEHYPKPYVLPELAA